MEQRIIEIMHDTKEMFKPDMNSDFRSRFRYLVYKSSSCEFSAKNGRKEVIYLKAKMPQAQLRKISFLFFNLQEAYY